MAAPAHTTGEVGCLQHGRLPPSTSVTRNEAVVAASDTTEVIEIKSDDETENDDDSREISRDKLDEYKEMLEQLGNHADKVSINTLSMIAEDYEPDFPSASALYKLIRSLLVDTAMSPDRKLPLVYAVDSILKNVKDDNRGTYWALVQKDAKNWIPVLHDSFLQHGYDESRNKLRVVWNTWKDLPAFAGGKDETIAAWKQMGQCFFDFDAKLKTTKMVATAKAKAAGISRAPDGTLQLSISLRKQMQIVLDEMQANVVDELEKVSLERLADINHDLLLEIKKAAEEMLKNGDADDTRNDGAEIRSSGGRGVNNLHKVSPSFKSTHHVILSIETRPAEVVYRAAEWERLDVNYLEKSHEVIAKLQQEVRIRSSHPSSHNLTLGDATNNTNLLASASVTATNLTKILDNLKTQQQQLLKQQKGSSGNSSLILGYPGFSSIPNYSSSSTSSNMYKGIDKTKFTTEGIREHNELVIALLYDAGLPFVSSSDGRRFATQIGLSRHLDALFQKNQLEKTMERTEERGWYSPESVWTGRASVAVANVSSDAIPTMEDIVDASTCTVPADESRDRCVICGINFTMYFDQEEGEWKYSNCREVTVLNDDAVAEEESEAMLVHATCLRGLGSPEYLTVDQILQKH